MIDSYTDLVTVSITSDEILHFKWQDWCESMHVPFLPHQISAYWSYGKGILPQMKKRVKKYIIQRQLRTIYQQASPSLSKDDIFLKKLDAMEYALNATKQQLLSE